jgi:hypothetical protein
LNTSSVSISLTSVLMNSIDRDRYSREICNRRSSCGAIGRGMISPE